MPSQFREIWGQSEVFRYCTLIVAIGTLLLYYNLAGTSSPAPAAPGSPPQASP